MAQTRVFSLRADAATVEELNRLKRLCKDSLGIGTDAGVADLMAQAMREAAGDAPDAAIAPDVARFEASVEAARSLFRSVSALYVEAETARVAAEGRVAALEAEVAGLRARLGEDAGDARV